MDQQSSQTISVENTNAVRKSHAGIGWKIQLGILCVMMVLALGGMALTLASQKGAWEYWLLVVVVYAGLGLWRTMSQSKMEKGALRALIVRELIHWFVLLGFLAVLLFLERLEIVNRQSASDFAVMMLALTCCLAGVHFDWLLLIVGVVLTIMVLAMAILQQYTMVLWIVMVLVFAGAAVIIYVTSKRKGSEVEPID